MDRADVRTITKKELSERIADTTGEKRTAVRKVLQAFLNEVVSELSRGNRIEFREFGVFEIKTRAARTAQNPRTLERVPVPERRSVKFKPGSSMRKRIEGYGDEAGPGDAGRDRAGPGGNGPPRLDGPGGPDGSGAPDGSGVPRRPSGPFPEPKTGVSPRTDGLGTRADEPLHLDGDGMGGNGKPAREEQAAQRA